MLKQNLPRLIIRKIYVKSKPTFPAPILSFLK